MAQVRAASIIVALGHALWGCGTAPVPVPAPARTVAPVARAKAPDTPPPEPPPPPPPTLVGFDGTVAEVLTAKSLWRLSDPQRARLAAFGRVRSSTDGDVQGHASAPRLGSPLGMIVVEDANRPRVVMDRGGFRLILHVERDDLHPLIVAPTALRLRPDEVLSTPPTRATVELGPGTLVEVSERRADWVKIAYHGERVHEGWVPRNDVGTVYRSRALPALPEASPSAEALADVWVLEKPGGSRWTELASGDWATVVGKGKRHLLVTVSDPCKRSIRLTGYVRRSKLKVHAAGGLGLVGCGRGRGGHPVSLGAYRDRKKVTVEPGRFLLDPKTTQVVGCVRKTAKFAQGEGQVLYAPTVWGPIAVTLAPKEVEASCLPDKKSD